MTPRVVTCSLYTCIMCYCVISASAYTSAGPVSLKENGVFTFVSTSGCTDWHTAHSTLRPRHVVSCSSRSSQISIFPTSCANDAKSCDMFSLHLYHVLLCHLCICVHFRRAVSLKENGVFTFVSTSGYSDWHTAHSTHNTDEDEAKTTEEAFHDPERDEVQLVAWLVASPKGPQRTKNGGGGMIPRQAWSPLYA